MKLQARLAAIAFLAVLSVLLLHRYNGGRDRVRSERQSANQKGRLAFNLDRLPSNRDEVVDVMVCSDERTLGGMVVVVNSVLQHTETPVFFHLVTVERETEHVAEWLLYHHPSIVMEVIPFTTDLTNRLALRGNTRKELASPLNFARYWLPYLLPEVRGRLVYLDDDVLVLGDIKEMRDQPISAGHVIAASADTKNTMANFLNFDSATVKKLGIEKDSPAFNAGVFVCDVSAWREQNITDALVYWMERNTKEPIYGNGIGGGASQPPMLLALHSKVTPLDPDWHVRHFGWWMGNSYPNDLLDSGRVKLMHWNGRWKPWKSGKASKFAAVWHRYYLPDPRGEFTVRPPYASPMMT